MTWGTYYLVKHFSKKRDPKFGQRQEHIHFKIHLDKQKKLTSYVLPSKKFNPKSKKRTYLIYIGKYDVKSALKHGKILEKGVLDKIGPHKYTIGDKFIINIYQPPQMAKKKNKIFFVSYKEIKKPEKWWKKYKQYASKL